MNKSDENLPLYKIIERQLKTKLLNQEIRPGERVGTEQELIEKYKVSRSTIRQALKELEKENLIYRKPGKGTYANEGIGLNTKTNRQIAVVVPLLSQDFIANIITGIQEVADNAGYMVNLFITNNSIKREEEYLRKLNQKFDGVIIHPTNEKYYNEAVIELNKKLPLIMTGRYYRFIKCNYVVPDNYKGLYLATQHLINLGHKKIGVVSHQPLIQTSIEDRIRGYLDCLGDNNLPVNRDLMLTNLKDPCNLYSTNFSEDNLKQSIDAISDFLAKNKAMTAVAAIDDFLAREVIAAAKQINLRIPEDLSVTGFDNIGFSIMTDPPLTTIEWSQKNVGKVAALRLIEKIENFNHTKLITEVLPVTLVKRDSTAKR